MYLRIRAASFGNERVKEGFGQLHTFRPWSQTGQSLPMLIAHEKFFGLGFDVHEQVHSNAFNGAHAGWDHRIVTGTWKSSHGKTGNPYATLGDRAGVVAVTGLWLML